MTILNSTWKMVYKNRVNHLKINKDPKLCNGDDRKKKKELKTNR